MTFEHLCYDHEKAVRDTQHGERRWITYRCEVCFHETTYAYDSRQGTPNLNEERSKETRLS